MSVMRLFHWGKFLIVMQREQEKGRHVGTPGHRPPFELFAVNISFSGFSFLIYGSDFSMCIMTFFDLPERS